LKTGDIVIIKATDDWREHFFLVDEVYEDCVVGMALTGDFAGSYGEPELDLITKVYREVVE
jgi:hypothetical protein